MTKGKRIYVLDTNVLMHDPTALFKFEEHDVFIPMMVLEELDNGKKGHTEAARNARLQQLLVQGIQPQLHVVAGVLGQALDGLHGRFELSARHDPNLSTPGSSVPPGPAHAEGRLPCGPSPAAYGLGLVRSDLE